MKAIKSTYYPERLPFTQWQNYIKQQLNPAVNKPRKGGIGYEQQQEETIIKMNVAKEIAEIAEMVYSAGNRYYLNISNDGVWFSHLKENEEIHTIKSYLFEDLDYAGANGGCTPFRELKETIKQYINEQR